MKLKMTVAIIMFLMVSLFIAPIKLAMGLFVVCMFKYLLQGKGE